MSNKNTEKHPLIPPEFLRAIAIWSLIPSYLIAGGLIGYGLDRYFYTFPYITSGGLLLALGLAVRDVLRLKEMMFRNKRGG